jgi:hypothetical protein
VPEPLSADYLRRTQEIVASVPVGPWEPIPNDYGTPDAVGPISYLECFAADTAPVVMFVAHAREALPRYVGEVSRQEAEIRALKARIRQLERARGRCD